MYLGVCSVSKRACQRILSSGPGSAITIVIGGAAESLSARPGTAGRTSFSCQMSLSTESACPDLTLKKRLGFIKIAIQQGYDPDGCSYA